MQMEKLIKWKVEAHPQKDSTPNLSFIFPSPQVKCLGVILDSFSCASYVNNIIVFIPLLLLLTAVLIHSLINFCLLFYCNFLFFDLPHKTIHKLQPVQNTVIWIITQTPSIHPLTPTKLHWTPIIHDFSHIILLLTFKTIIYIHLSGLLHNATPIPTLRFSPSVHFSVPPLLVLLPCGAFSRSALQLWNSLSPDHCNTNSLQHFKSYALWF